MAHGHSKIGIFYAMYYPGLHPVQTGQVGQVEPLCLHLIFLMNIRLRGS